MASSGQMNGSSRNIGGNGGNYFFIKWQLAHQNIGSNYSRINWQAYFHYNMADAQLDDGIASLSGTRWRDGGRVRNYSANFSTRNVALASGSFNIGHRSDGTQTLSVSGGVDVYQSGRSSGSASWSLPTIPRNSQVSTNDSGHYTLGTPINIYTNRKSSSFTHTIRIRKDNNSGTLIKQFNSVGSSVTWTPTQAEIDTMQAMIPNENVLKLCINSYNNQVKDDSWVYVNSYLTDANPTFSDFTYADTDTTTTGITGDNQVLVKGKSNLRVTVSSANKMVAIKSATPKNYAFIYDGLSQQQNYATTQLTQDFTNVDTVGSRTIQVTAYDSRNNSTQVAKNVQVYDYTIPIIDISVVRENNFGQNVTITTAGTFDLLPINGTNKNALTASSLKYRYKESTASTWGAWNTIAFTVTGNEFTGTDKFEVLDNSKAYDFEFEVADKFGAVTQTATLGTGVPLMFIGESGTVGINKMPENGALDVEGDIYSNGVKVAIGDDDTGWLDIPLDSAWVQYSASDTPQYRIRGNLVELRGAIKRSSSNAANGVFGNLPVIARPNVPSRLVWVCQGSGNNHWAMSVYASGELVAERYTGGNFTTGSWHPFQMMYWKD